MGSYSSGLLSLCPPEPGQSTRPKGSPKPPLQGAHLPAHLRQGVCRELPPLPPWLTPTCTVFPHSACIFGNFSPTRLGQNRGRVKIWQAGGGRTTQPPLMEKKKKNLEIKKKDQNKCGTRFVGGETEGEKKKFKSMSRSEPLWCENSFQRGDQDPERVCVPPQIQGSCFCLYRTQKTYRPVAGISHPLWPHG